MTDEQAGILESWRRRTTMPQGMATRAGIVLAGTDGETPMSVAHAQRVAPKTVDKWRNRFLEIGTGGLADQVRFGCPGVIDDAVVAHDLAGPGDVSQLLGELQRRLLASLTR